MRKPDKGHGEESLIKLGYRCSTLSFAVIMIVDCSERSQILKPCMAGISKLSLQKSPFFYEQN